MAEPLFLGVDGGGTGCRARLETADGVVLGTGRSGPASMRFGFAAALYSVMTAAQQAVRESGLGDEAYSRIHAGVGLAGTGIRGARRALEDWEHPFASAWFEGDGYMALLAGRPYASAAMASLSPMKAAAPTSASTPCVSPCARWTDGTTPRPSPRR